MSAAQLQRDGWCVVEDVLDGAGVAHARAALLQAAQGFEAAGGSTYMPELDPNASNVRVFNLIDLHAVFRELILHPAAVGLVESLLGPEYRISNFTANIALPGSRSMALHSDQALVAPPPWLSPWSMNIIWCLDDVYEANGATRYVPGSHRYQSLDDLPDDPMSMSRAFEAPRGSVIAMDGRMWHTSGANTTVDIERALLFGYYSVDFIRPQVNWNAVLSLQTQAELNEELFTRLVLGPESNVRYAGEIMARDLGNTFAHAGSVPSITPPAESLDP
jgi:ectoine hydroxylase-related dioxygenase (phytanoyl-CoA dioxygenase family)